MSDASRFRPAVRLFGAAATSYVLGGGLFVLVINLLYAVVKVVGGPTAFGALLGIVATGLAGVAFFLGVPAYYSVGSRRGSLWPRWLLVTAVQAFMVPVLRVLHYVVVFFLKPGVVDWVLGALALVASGICSVLAARGFATARARHRQAVETSPSR